MLSKWCDEARSATISWLISRCGRSSRGDDRMGLAEAHRLIPETSFVCSGAERGRVLGEHRSAPSGWFAAVQIYLLALLVGRDSHRQGLPDTNSHPSLIRAFARGLRPWNLRCSMKTSPARFRSCSSHRASSKARSGCCAPRRWRLFSKTRRALEPGSTPWERA